MNYIKKLQAASLEQADTIAHYQSIIDDLRRYLESDKFRCGDDLDGYVNVRDVLSYLDAITVGTSVGPEKFTVTGNFGIQYTVYKTDSGNWAWKTEKGEGFTAESLAYVLEYLKEAKGARI